LRQIYCKYLLDMEIVSENDQEIGVVFTLREFRILFSVLGQFAASSINDARMTRALSHYANWSDSKKYSYLCPADIACKGTVPNFTIEEDKLFEMQSM